MTRVTWKIIQHSNSYINFASLWWINAIHFQIYFVAFKFCWSVHSWIVIYIVNMQNRCSYYDKNLRLEGICLLLHWWNDGIHTRYLACSRKQYTVNVLKFWTLFLFDLFSNKMLIFRAGIHKMLVRIANREDLDQTTSLEALLIWVCTVCLGVFNMQLKCSKF